jgi:hypothetical protein
MAIESALHMAEPKPAIDMIKQPVRSQLRESQVTELDNVMAKQSKEDDEDTIESNMFVHHGVFAHVLQI